MATDDKKVQEYIDTALKKHARHQRVKQVYEAWLELVALRRAGCFTEENVVAAEHYLYARHGVASGEYTVTEMKWLADGYDLGKKILVGPLERIARADEDCPVAPPSKDITRWGYKGSDDGHQDWIYVRTPQKFTPRFKSTRTATRTGRF